MKLLAGVLFCLMLVIPGQAAAGEATYFLFRHAEKKAAGENPGLTPAGQKRAERLAEFLRKEGVTRIFSTDTQRTRDTVAPLAQRMDLEIEIYDGHDLTRFAERLKEMTGVIAISGHSNTTPELAALLSGQGTEPMTEGEYDRFYVVIRSGQAYMLVRGTQKE